MKPTLIVTEHARIRAAERDISDRDILRAFAGRKVRSHQDADTYISTSSSTSVVYRVIGRTIELITCYREHTS